LYLYILEESIFYWHKIASRQTSTSSGHFTLSNEVTGICLNVCYKICGKQNFFLFSAMLADSAKMAWPF
jgi:hypothetical protein